MEQTHPDGNTASGSDTSAVPPRSSLYQVLRNRNFNRLFFAGVASTAGGTIGSLALIWIAYNSTHSALVVAYVAIAELLAVVVMSLPGGVWVDRYNRRTLMILSDVSRAAAMGGLALFFYLMGFGLPVVLVVVFVTSGFSTLFGPAENSLIPSIVHKSELSDANALVRSSRNIISLVSSSVGGVILLVFGAVLSLFFNSLTYVASAVLIFGVSVSSGAIARADPPSQPKERKMTRELAEGLRWLIRKAPGLWELSISALFMNFFNTMFLTFIVVFVVVTLHGSALVYGLFLAGGTLGGTLGTFLTARTSAIRHVGKVWVLIYGLACGAALTMLAFSTSPYLSFVLFFAFSLASSFGGNAWLTAAQTIVPSEMQGRYFGLDGILSYGVMPVAQVIGGVLITTVGITPTVEIAGIGLMVSGVLSLVGRNLWKLDGTVGPVPV
jgi:MFS family permease